MIRTITLTLIASIPLAACDLPTLPPVNPVKPTTYHDVLYYDSNPLERMQTAAWCGNNPGLAMQIPSCDSASTSGIRAWHHQMGWN